MFELTKIFPYLAIMLISAERYCFAQAMDFRPILSPYIYIITNLKPMPYIEVNLIVCMLTQIFMDTKVYPRYGQHYTKDFHPELNDDETQTNYDTYIACLLCFIVYLVNKIVPYLGLENRKSA
jgi:hypothetical protein